MRLMPLCDEQPERETVFCLKFSYQELNFIRNYVLLTFEFWFLLRVFWLLLILFLFCFLFMFYYLLFLYLVLTLLAAFVSHRMYPFLLLVNFSPWGALLCRYSWFCISYLHWRPTSDYIVSAYLQKSYHTCLFFTVSFFYFTRLIYGTQRSVEIYA